MRNEQILKKAIERAGKKCKKFQYGCFRCDIHLALQILEAWFDETEIKKGGI